MEDNSNKEPSRNVYREWKYKFADQDDWDEGVLSLPDIDPKTVAEMAARKLYDKNHRDWPNIVLVRKCSDKIWTAFTVNQETIPRFISTRDNGSDCEVDDENED